MIYKRFKIKIPGFGVLTGRYGHDWERGATVYQVQQGPRVAGSFEVAHRPRLLEPVPDHEGYWGERSTCEVLDVDAPMVMVHYGAGDKPGFLDHEREDRPRVNGITLCGGTCVNLATMRTRRLKRHDVNVSRGRYCGSAPEATAERTATVLHGLVAHWIGRPENYALRLVSYRRFAEKEQTDAARTVRCARERLERARLELERAQRYADQCAAAAAIPPGTLAKD